MNVKKCKEHFEAMKFCDVCSLMDIPYTGPDYDKEEKVWVVKYGTGDGL